jgi:Xaa-Pro aminopeptidase
MHTISPVLQHERARRLAAALRDSDVDIVVAASPENVHYCTGYRSASDDTRHTHQMAAILDRARDMVVVVGPAADAAPGMDAGVAPDAFVPYGEFYFEAVDGSAPIARMSLRHDSFATALAAALDRSSTTSAARIAVDRAGLRGHAGEVAAMLDGRHTADASGWLSRVRAVKTPGELRLLRRSTHVTEEAIAAAVDTFELGVTTELDLARVIAGEMVAGGGQPRFVHVTSGPRSALADAFSQPRVVRPGELVRIDAGCTVDGYWSDSARTFVAGRADATQVTRYAALLDGLSRLVDAAVAGAETRRMFELACARVRDGGIPGYRRHHVGHGVGLEVKDAPSVTAASADRLEPAMVLSVETPFYEVGWGGMMVEDTIAVTADGPAEVFNRLPRDLRVIG